MSWREEREKEERKNDIYSGHLRLCQQPRAAHALRSDQFNHMIPSARPPVGFLQTSVMGVLHPKNSLFNDAHTFFHCVFVLHFINLYGV